jgi:hypothetical protein
VQRPFFDWRYGEASGGISGLMQAIEAVGTRVAPAVRERLAAKSMLSETAMS